MKKILIMFLIFAVSLFAKFTESEKMTILQTTMRNDANFEIHMIRRNDYIDFSVIISKCYGEAVISMEIDDLFMQTSDSLDNSYWFEISKVKDMKYILQKIVDGKKIYIKTEHSNYLIDLKEYKNDIIKSKFYKELMKL